MQRIDLILKGRKNRKFRSSWPFDAHYIKITRADNLLEKIEKQIKSRNCIQEARKQFVTSYITALEVYFKDMLLRLLRIFGSTRLIEQVRLKFDIFELEKIIKEEISIEEVITSYFNFQDLDQINKVFSLIFNVSFFEELKNQEFKMTNSRLEPFEIHKDFYKEIKSFIDLRHDFVHEINFKHNITKAHLYKYSAIYTFFILGVDMYVEEKIRE